MVGALWRSWDPKGRLDFASAPAWVKLGWGEPGAFSGLPFLPFPNQGAAGPPAEVRLWGALHSWFGWWQGAGPGPGHQGSCPGPHLP